MKNLFIKLTGKPNKNSSKEDRTDAKDKENARLQAENASLKKELEKSKKVINYILDDFIRLKDESARLYSSYRLWLSSITSADGATHANYALVLEELMMKEKRVP